MKKIYQLYLFLFRNAWLRARKVFAYDSKRLRRYSAEFNMRNRASQEAKIVMTYHVVEKGLTMPNRRLGFGKANVEDLIERIGEFLEGGESTDQVDHAIGVLKAYAELHDGYDAKSDDPGFWAKLEAFLRQHPDIPVGHQLHFSREAFFQNKNSPFPEFARSRHTCRNYSSESIPMDLIEKSVSLAMTAPSACNRQHARVHCVSDKALQAEILSLQGGNRGFGHLADKLLVLTGDLRVVNVWERNDLFTNVGMFAMNLCHALHYHGIGHCVLNWSVKPKKDRKLRRLLPQLKPHETVVLLIACGIPPDEFDVASSPRRSLNEVLLSK